MLPGFEFGHLAESYRERLRKADIGRSCVRIKQLSDIDLDTVAGLIRAGTAAATTGDGPA